MSKKWTPVPESIEKELRIQVRQRYAELIATLPDGMPNPVYHIEHTKDGYVADVRFYSDGRYDSSLWECKSLTGSWNIYKDWTD
jgi:hypothetical protein